MWAVAYFTSKIFVKIKLPSITYKETNKQPR
jgi:hypothetical protein